jgi:hypothetical protein
MTSDWPTERRSGFVMPLASTIAWTDTPYRPAIADSESPYSTVTTSDGSVVVGGAVVVGTTGFGMVRTWPT